MSLHKNFTGRGLHEPAQYKVTNNTGATLTKGSIVKRTGYNGTMIVELSLNPVSDKRLGIVVDDIGNGELGHVASMGDFGGFDTSGWIAETLLYSDGTGALSDVAFGEPLGTVLRSDSSDGHILFYVDLPGQSGGSGGGHTVHTVVVTPTDISNGYILLPATPTEPISTIIKYEGAPDQIYGIDFSVTANQLTFLGLPVESGETITILYN